MQNISPQCWIGVVSREHVQRGISGAFVQLNHGKKAAVQRLDAGDYLVMYSPRISHPNGEPLQAFTAIGVVATGDVYQVDLSENFKPYRLKINYLEAKEAAIKPLINSLSFIKNKKYWGAAFRFGYLKVPYEDIEIISEAMDVDLLRH